MSEYVYPFIAVIVTILVVFTVLGVLVNAWWRKGKQWFAGFLDVHLTREENTKQVKLTVAVRDVEAPAAPVDVRRDA